MVIPGFLDLDQSKVFNLNLWNLKLWDGAAENLPMLAGAAQRGRRHNNNPPAAAFSPFRR